MTSPAAEFFGLPVATWAFFVACLSFAIAAFSLGWQILKHVLDGGRVRVYLNAAIINGGDSLATNDTGKWEMPYPFGNGPSRGNIEVAQLVVENPGRSSVTIHGPALAIYGTDKRKYSICPRMFAFDGNGSHVAVTDTLVRLDPYSRVTFLLDYWSVTSHVRGDVTGQSIKLRGFIRVAGRRRPAKSKWRLAWRIPVNAWTVRGISEIDPYTVMWRELYRSHWKRDEVADGPDVVSFREWEHALFQTVRKLHEMPSLDELTDALHDSLQGVAEVRFPVSLLALNMHAALKTHEAHLAAWPPAPPRTSTTVSTTP